MRPKRKFIPDENQKSDLPEVVTIRIDPGICGFDCLVRANRIDKRTVAVQVSGSECKQIQRLSGKLDRISLKELFMPMTRNPVYVAGENSGCHPSCSIPSAILKAVEAAMGMAIPKNVRIIIDSEKEGAE